MSTGRPLAAVPLKPLAPDTHEKAEVKLPNEFNVLGILALRENNQFALFGQLTERDGVCGYVEYCDAQTKVTGQVRTTGSIWHATALPQNARGAQIAVLEDNPNNHPESPDDAIRSRVVHAQSDTPSDVSASPKGSTWTPDFVTHPAAATAPAGIAGKKAWRIHLNDRKVEQHRDLPHTNETLPVPTSSQYFAYSPNGQHVIAGCMTGTNVALCAQGKDHAFTAPLPLTKIHSKDFLAAMWFSDSRHYVISTLKHGLVFGNVEHPRLSVRVKLPSPTHAMTTIPHSATLVTSHRDGSVHVYDAQQLLARLDKRTNRCASVDLLTTLKPSKAGLFGRREDVLIDIASLSDEKETALLMHQRGTQTIERITLKHNSENWKELQKALLNIFETDSETAYKLLGLIKEYAQFYVAPIQQDNTSTVAADHRPPRLI